MGLSGGLSIHLMIEAGMAWPAAVAIGVGAGVVVGLINGVLIAYIGASSFIATLAAGSLATAMELQLTGGIQLTDGIPTSFSDLGTMTVLGVRLTTLVALVFALVLWVIVERSEFGRRLRAVGGNADAAFYSGVPVERIRLAAFTITATCAAVTGIVLAAETATYAPNAGHSYLIPTYAAAFKPGMVMTNEPGIYIREDALYYFPKTPEWQAFVEKFKPNFQK